MAHEVTYRQDINFSLYSDPKLRMDFFYTNIFLSLAFVLVTLVFLLRHGKLLTRFNFWLMVSFSNLIILRSVVYFTTVLLFKPVVERQLINNDSCISSDDFAMYVSVH